MSGESILNSELFPALFWPGGNDLLNFSCWGKVRKGNYAFSSYKRTHGYIIIYYFKEGIPIWDIMNKAKENLEWGPCHIGLAITILKETDTVFLVLHSICQLTTQSTSQVACVAFDHQEKHCRFRLKFLFSTVPCISIESSY